MRCKQYQRRPEYVQIRSPTGYFRYLKIYFIVFENRFIFPFNLAPPSFDSKEESMLILVGCLGAFVLVLLILIIVCLVKKKNKPQNQALESSPEARERMIEPSTSRYNSPNSMTNTSPTTEYYWSTHHPKIGQPLPPTPVEKNIAHSPLESRHQYRTRGHSRAMI